MMDELAPTSAQPEIVSSVPDRLSEIQHVTSASRREVPLVGVPTTLPAGATMLHFEVPVRAVELENNTPTGIQYDIERYASPGSFQCPASAHISLSQECQDVGLYLASASLLNGIVGGNIVVRGYR